ncbi:ribonuclease HII [Bizionia sediminis]|uniref:Ribonuclease HII n=1 Tax=Bizionia sediminis TaxID=1737064 RepID=A0ABW5KRX5_9FLAO
MKNIWFLSILSVLLLACNSSKKKAQLADYLSNDASVIVKVNNMASLKSNISNNAFLQTLESAKNYQTLLEKLDVLNYLKTEEELFLSLFETPDDVAFSVATKLTPNLFHIDSVPNINSANKSKASKNIMRTTIANNTFYYAVRDSVFIGASAKHILDNILNSKSVHPNIKTLIKASGPDNQLSVFVNKKQDKALQALLINTEIATELLTDYMFLDIDVDQNALKLNGVVKSADSSLKLIDVFKNTKPQENRLATVTPANSDGFLSLTFQNYAEFHKNLKPFKSPDSSSNKVLLDNVIEAGVIYEGSNRAVVLHSLDMYITKDALLNDQDMIETFREIPIYSFSRPEFFVESFFPFISFNQANMYCILDNFIVFSDNTDFLHTIIASYKNQTTFSNRSPYTDLQAHFSDEASLLSVVNPDKLEALLHKNLNDSVPLKLDAFKASGIQFVYDTNFAHVHAVVQKAKVRAVENAVTEMASVTLDNPLLNTPQLVTNHITKEKEIVVQDVKNNLYLISNSGKILWKKQLNNPILGQISQIDMYKNGRLQLAFSTSNAVYVLDRNGKDVKPFPVKLNDAITQPLAVFDYDNTKNYRLVVTQNKQLLMLDAKGKSVKGFSFNNTSGSIIHQPQHIRIGRKDYIVVKTANKLYILNRVGKPRVTPKSQQTYSAEAVYLYQGNFATTTKDGNFVTIDQSGNTAIQNLNLTEQHGLVTTSKTRVTLSENKLSIKGNTYELDYGNYSKPVIFYLQDKIYVSVTDKQTQKVFLFDSNANLLNNFPVYGTSAIDMANMDKGKNLEFVTSGGTDTILIYEIN